MKRLVAVGLIISVTIVVGLAFFWFNTQPVWPVNEPVDMAVFNKLPTKNKQVVEFITSQGKALAPTYEGTVCTEFVIKVIDEIDKPLTNAERKLLSVVTTARLDSLIEGDSPIIRGVQTALLLHNKGTAIYESDEVLPGDFVQFWNVFHGTAFGHCGVVLAIEPNRTLTLYSSHPFTGGYGTQKFLWPQKAYFVRLK